MAKDERFWLNLSYVVAGFLFALIGYKAITTVGIQTGWLEKYDSWFPLVATIGGIVIGGLGVWIAAGDSVRTEYYLATIAEVKKVNWPTGPDTWKMTKVVVIVCAIFGVILAIFDTIWAWILKFIIA
jgi:preprotein translocase SecE subunit